jgi:outer membrane protein OmpA-like peptidoglycan-associated protein
MRRRAWPVVAALVLFAAPASASMPPSFFFASGSARIRLRDLGTFDWTMREIRSQGVDAVCIVASTDRVGSRAYNQRLSRLRADAVRRELVRRGFSGTVTIRAWGEGRGLVETADGVTEVNNRFAMIFYGANGCPLET